MKPWNQLRLFSNTLLPTLAILARRLILIPKPKPSSVSSGIWPCLLKVLSQNILDMVVSKDGACLCCC